MGLLLQTADPLKNWCSVPDARNGHTKTLHQDLNVMRVTTVNQNQNRATLGKNVFILIAN